MTSNIIFWLLTRFGQCPILRLRDPSLQLLKFLSTPHLLVAEKRVLISTSSRLLSLELQEDFHSSSLSATKLHFSLGQGPVKVLSPRDGRPISY